MPEQVAEVVQPLFVDALVGGFSLALLGLGLRTSLGRRLTSLLSRQSHALRGRTADPLEALDVAYRRQAEALQQARRGIAEVVTSHKRLELQAKGFRETQVRLREEARQALLSGREDLARIALTRAQATAARLASLELQVTELRDQGTRLELATQRLKTRVEGFRSQKEAFRAQYSAAQASVRIGETITGISKEMGEVGRMLEAARERTLQMQARAAAVSELVATYHPATIGRGGDESSRQLRATGGEARGGVQRPAAPQHPQGAPLLNSSRAFPARAV
ncbi:MAG: PspA/IM30 family protein, partial [Candidatus Dormibacteria bacterium]